MKRLIILDLDNTLIFSDFSDRLKVRKLFKYRDFLYVYERPYAKEFIQRCHELGEVMIFTMAEWEYADQISEHLNIRPSRIFSNEECINQDGSICKSLPDQYYEIYDQIIVVDDYPEIWEIRNHELCRFIVPIGFTGDKRDNDLKILMNKLTEFEFSR